tara:strand:+ start:604 stop:801 length:198 start_codon:yes stop_codon:yes gene_type:complete
MTAIDVTEKCAKPNNYSKSNNARFKLIQLLGWGGLVEHHKRVRDTSLGALRRAKKVPKQRIENNV